MQLASIGRGQDLAAYIVLVLIKLDDLFALASRRPRPLSDHVDVGLGGKEVPQEERVGCTAGRGGRPRKVDVMRSRLGVAVDSEDGEGDRWFFGHEGYQLGGQGVMVVGGNCTLPAPRFPLATQLVSSSTWHRYCLRPQT